jgi:hypothetical protein
MVAHTRHEAGKTRALLLDPWLVSTVKPGVRVASILVTRWTGSSDALLPRIIICNNLETVEECVVDRA